VIASVERIFRDRYGVSGQLHRYFSPGRVNLIGEHIDYNGGFVLPAALSLGNYGVFARRSDRNLRLYSENLADAGTIECDLSDLSFRREDGWANYVKGVVREFLVRGVRIDHGFDAVVWGDLPQGSGLSSSASIELLFAVYLNDVLSLGLTRSELSILCKKVENEYIGVACGIMDQFVIANGRKDHALLLNCDTLAFEQIPLRLGAHAIVILDSRVQRGLAGSKYNERRDQCDKAFAILRRWVSAPSLCAIDPETFASLEPRIGDDVLCRRARHAVTENARVLAAVAALKSGDLVRFGRLMDASHASLRDDYEVSVPELDYLVDASRRSGALGARMTGAGFGGSAVAVVPLDKVPGFSAAVKEGYRRSFGRDVGIYIAETSDGTRRSVQP
jgi:galactokinase